MTQTTAPQMTVLKDVAVTRYEHRKPNFYGGIEAAQSIPQGRIIKGNGFRDIPEEINVEAGGRFFNRKTDVERLKGEWLFGGPLWSHFGHFFTDCVHRLWPLIVTPDAYQGVVFLAVKGLENIRTDAQLHAVKPPAYLHDLLKLLDLGQVKIRYVKQPTRVERLVVFPAGTGLHAPISDFYRPCLRELQTRIARNAQIHVARAPERLYLGRRHLLRKGGILGSSYWEKALKTNGFYAATPEAMSLANQFGHLLGAKTIVMDEGSAAHPTQILDRIDAEFLMLPRRTGRNPFETMIGARADFTTLVKKENIAVLPDREGKTSTPAGVAVYRDPTVVFEDMKSRGLLQGQFEQDAYVEAEAADLDASDATDPAVSQTRRDLLQYLQAERRGQS